MNELRHQNSPFLRDHAKNPVNWHPWGSEAIALANRKNKPILLCIGYSANQLCQVMERESFSSNQIAKLMNNQFVNILVDREERPDIDRLYQAGHRLLTRSGGGWPLTVFLDPKDQLPFYSGTYFPAQASRAAPSFREVLNRMAETYDKQYDKIEEFKSRLSDAISQTLGIDDTSGTLDPLLIERACGQIDGSFDDKHGGFSGAPKLPHPAGLELLHTVSVTDDKEKSERAAYMLDFSLSAMSYGGLYDHLGGGFFGHSIDATWTIPHFEKMLYDNAQLLSLFSRRAGQTKSPWFAEVANCTANWMMREMQLEAGGFCASLDAVSNDGEGKFYLWSKDEIGAVLNDCAKAFNEQFGLNGGPNFDGRWHLRLAEPKAEAAESADKPWDINPHVDYGNERQRLWEVREQRSKPAREEQIVTAWNALSIGALAEAGQILNRPECLTAAAKAADFLRETHWKNGRLAATSHKGKIGPNGYLDDYVYLIDAMLTLLSAHWRGEDLNFAISLADTLLEQFEDDKHGGFYFSAHDQSTLVHRSKPLSDDQFPAGNGIAAKCLFELGNLLGESRYIDAAKRTLDSSMGAVEAWPSAHATLLRALQDVLNPPTRIVLLSDGDPSAWLETCYANPKLPARCYLVPVEQDLNGRKAVDKAGVTAYIYKAQDCSPAITDIATFAEHF